MTLDPTAQNDFFVRLTGKGNIEKPLIIGENYKLISSGTITSFTESDKHDGTHTFYYKFEPVLIEVVNDLGEAIRAKDTRSFSSLFRARMWKEWSKSPQGLTFEEIYERLMSRLIQQGEEIYQMYGE